MKKINIKNKKQFDELTSKYATIVDRLVTKAADFERENTRRKVDFVDNTKQDAEDKVLIEKALLNYVDENQSEFINDKVKSYVNKFISLTIKKGKKKLDYLVDFNEEKVIVNIKSIFSKKVANQYITTKESIAKAVISKAVASNDITEEQLEEIGLFENQVTNITIKPL